MKLLSLILLLLIPFNVSAAPLKVAHILPQSGDAANFGKSFLNGFEMGLEDEGEDAKNYISVKVQDDQLDPKKSILAYKHLMATQNPDIVITVASGSGNALKTLTENDNKTLIAIASDSKIAINSKYAFTFWITPEKEAEAFVAQLEARQIKKFAIFVTQQEGAIAIVDAVKKILPPSISITNEIVLPPKDRDFKSHIIPIIRNTSLSEVAIITLPGQIGLLAKQLRQYGYKGNFFSIESFDDANEVKLAEGTLSKAWHITSHKLDESFIKRYHNNNPNGPVWGVGEGYDLARILIKAAKDLKGNYTTENLTHYLRNIQDYSGVLGTFSSSGDNRFTIQAGIATVP